MRKTLLYLAWIIFVSISSLFLLTGCSSKYEICDHESKECYKVVKESEINKEFLDDK